MARRRFQSGHSALVTLPDAKRRQALCTAHGSKWASTVTYWAICASASNSLTRDAHVTDDTARHLRYTSRAKREADVSLSHSPWPFWRGETGAAWEFHGSDGSAGAPWLSIH